MVGNKRCFGIAVFINVIMIIYKMFKHEPMNNPALGEKPDWFIMLVLKGNMLFYFAKA